MLIGPYTFRQLVLARNMLGEDAYPQTSVREVAAAVGLSPYHFIRQFGALFGVTPHQLRTRVRLERAKSLLARGAGVTETCTALGFSSLGSFSAWFAREMGVSPSRYRGGRIVQVPRSFPPEVFPGCLGLMAQLPSRNFREAVRG